MPRCKSPRLTDRDVIRALQLIRLEGLPTGEYEPMSNREEMYLRIVRAGHPVDIEERGSDALPTDGMGKIMRGFSGVLTIPFGKSGSN